MTLFQVIAVLFVIGFALYFGQVVAKHSIKIAKIRGGKKAELFHLAACTMMAGLIPSILAAAFIFHLGLIAFLWGVSLFGFIFLCLFGYAAYELPARARARQPEDRGWTAEDARTSGL